jgi:anti-sigma factor RsiW
MNCTEVKQTLVTLLRDEMDAGPLNELQRHLEQCAECRREQACWDRLRGLLDALPLPPVTVDVGHLYAEVDRLRGRQLRRWRRLTGAAVAVAATLFLALAFRVELRLDRHGAALSWGSHPEPAPLVQQVPLPPSPPPAPVERVNAEDVRLVKALIRALATDVESRDARQQDKIANLQTRFDVFRRQELERWQAAARDVAALYTLQYHHPDKGEKR